MAASEKKSRGQSPSRSARRECCGIPPPNGGHHAWCMRPHARARPAPRVQQEVDPRAAVTRVDHSALEDRLEAANVRALDAWLRGGRVL